LVQIYTMPEKRDTKPDRAKVVVAAVDKVSGSWRGPLPSGSILKAYILSISDKIDIIRNGISKKQLTDIKTEIEVDYDELSEILGTSRATLIAKKNTQKFDPQVSERIMMLTDVVAYGRDIFGDKDNFNEWLKTPSEALGNVTPLSMMDTLYGIEEIKREIGRIAHGVY
jgi:putative toxin-antitoxin system antitoxin component (TIGR02293 family)